MSLLSGLTDKGSPGRDACIFLSDSWSVCTSLLTGGGSGDGEEVGKGLVEGVFCCDVLDVPTTEVDPGTVMLELLLEDEVEVIGVPCKVEGDDVIDGEEFEFGSEGEVEGDC